MAHPKRIEARKAEAIERLADKYDQLDARLERIEKKIDALLGKKAKPDKAEPRPEKAPEQEAAPEAEQPEGE